MRSRSGFVAPAVLLAVGLATWASTAAGALEKVSFRVTKRLSSVVAHIAAAEGFFEDEGLEVEMVFWDKGSLVIPLLSQGKMDVSDTSSLSPAYINIIRRGGRVRLVAAKTVHSPDGCGYFSFVARSELIESGRLNELSSVRGLRIATDRTSSSYYYWTRLLKEAGLTLDDVEIRDVPTSAKPDAIAKGLVDISSQSEPWTTRVVATGSALRWRPLSDLLPNHQSTFLVFGHRLLSERRDLGRRFMAAYMRAVRQYIEQDKSEHHIDIVSRATGLTPADLRQMCWPTMAADGHIDPTSLEEYEEWALEQGLIDEIVPVTDLIDDGFLPPRETPPLAITSRWIARPP